MTESEAAGSLSEFLGRLAAEFNRSLGSVSREAFSYEAQGRAIVLEIVQFGHAALNALARPQSSARTGAFRARSDVEGQPVTAEVECAERQIVVLERAVEHAAATCVYLLYVLCGSRQPAWIVHGLSSQDSLESLRSDMDEVMVNLEVR